MNSMNKYRILKKQIYTNNYFSIKPIELDKKYDIMKWRNEQIFHLRQVKKLSKIDQDNYFDSVVSKLFNLKYPDQILFSFYYKNEFIGYGGLVHIDWNSFNSEISFLMNTKLEKKFFEINWINFLKLIEEVAFSSLKLTKVYIYAYDLRPQLFKILKENKYTNEAVLKNQYLLNSNYYDVKIFSKFKK